MAKISTIPEDTSLQLTKAEWLALKGILELFCEDNDAPFLEHHGQLILNRMGGYVGLSFGGFETHEEYTEWYKNHAMCSCCGKYELKASLTLVDGDQLCCECKEEEEEDNV